MPDRGDPIRVVCAVQGESHVRHCATMLHSLLSAHAPGEVRVDYLHGPDTSERGRRRLKAMVGETDGEVAFHAIPDSWVRGLPVKGFTRKATWYRLFLDRLLPDADRVLYLDLDLLVLDSLWPLWRTPLEGNVLAAVTNVPLPNQRPYVERPELGGDRYFNAGVLLIDLDVVRAEEIGRQLREFSVRNGPRLVWRDQDSLNELLHARRLALHPRWNCMNSVMNFAWASEYFDEQELAEARRNPAIRHFEGPDQNKPWHLLCDPEVQRQYLEHRRQTPWPRLRRSGRTPRNLVKYARRRLV